MITVYQATGSTVTPLADGKLYEYLSGNAVGVIMGCQITSLGGLQIQVSAGWIIILGRMIEIQQETITVTPSTSGEVDGRLIFHLDVSNDEAPGVWITQAQTPLPALTQEDINGSGTIYEMPMETYQVDQLQVTGLQTVFPIALGPIPHRYLATYDLDGWTASSSEDQGNGYPYTQTITVTPLDPNAPPVTENSEFEPYISCAPTGVAQTDKVLREALTIISQGISTSGNGTITTIVQEQPMVDIPVIWKLKTEVL